MPRTTALTPALHWLAAVSALLASGCAIPAGNSAGTAHFGEPIASTSGKLSVTVTSDSGSELVRGSNELEFHFLATATDANLDELALSMVPFMPAMGHGSAELPSVAASGPGSYRFANVVLPMSGLWELRTTIGGSESDYVAPRFEVR